MKTHHDLNVWQKSVEYVTDIYKTTSVFPTEEKFGLTNQIRRSGVSIPSNIAEGAARNSSKDFIRFLRISMGSAAELQTQLIIAHNLQYLDEKKFDYLMSSSLEISRMLNGLIQSVKRKE